MAHASGEEAVAERSADGDEREDGVLAEFELVLQLWLLLKTQVSESRPGPPQHPSGALVLDF
jgi:hypothetical protein